MICKKTLIFEIFSRLFYANLSIMLLEFKFKNSRSFYEEQCFSMIAAKIKDLPENIVSLDGVPSLKGVSALKSAVIYGSNASGKTGFIYSILNAIRLIKESFLYEPDDVVFHQTFNSNERIKEATSYSFEFILNNTRYTYSYSCDFNSILSEELIHYPKGKKKELFSRFKNEDGSYTWDLNRSLKKERAIKELTMKNVLFLSRAATLDSKVFEPVYKWFVGKFQIFNFSNGMAVSSDFTEKLIIENPQKLSELLEFMKKADFGINNIKVDEDTNLQTSNDRIRFLHKGLDIPFTKAMESAGTNRLFNLWSVITTILEKGDILIVDELENSLHPLLLSEVIKLFHSEKNTKGAQLIFTSHCPFLMKGKILRRDQFWFCEKNEQGESTMFPLSDFKIRNDFSLENGYLTGRFGAIPNIEPLM